MIFQDLAAPNVPVSSLAKPCSHLLLQPHKLLMFLEYMPLCLCLCSSPAEHILVSTFQVSTPGASLLKLSLAPFPLLHVLTISLRKNVYSHLPSLYLCGLRV